MRPRRWIVLLMFPLVLTYVLGCTSFLPMSDLQPGIYEAVRVTRNDGETVRLTQVEIDSFSVKGNSSGLGVRERTEFIGGIPTSVRDRRAQRIEILLSEIQLLEEQRFSASRTVGLISLVAVGTVGTFFLLVLLSMD